MHILTNAELRKEFIKMCLKDFNIIGGDLMETYLGIKVEQSDGKICLYLDKYIQDIVTEFSAF
jgi:hypothetical protein